MDRFLIAPVSSGLQSDLKPWLIADDAFSQMYNAYVFRGRVKKRIGSELTGSPQTTLNSRLRRQVGTTNAGGNFAPAVAVPPAVSTEAGIGATFSIGTTIFTVWQAAGAMKTTGAATGTYTVATGTLSITGADALTAIYYYPGVPVMGLGIYDDGNINSQPAFAFDTRNPYKYNGAAWNIQNSSAASAPIFTGTTDDYFWSSTWIGMTADQPVMFVSNYVDPIYTWDGTDWAIFSPPTVSTEFNANGDFVYTARIILPFKGRLVMLRTIEEDGGSSVQTEYLNRARWCAIGSPFAAGAWLIWEESFGGVNAFGGNFEDAATKEAIIGAEFIKDRLIVYFEYSTWELAYTGNEASPFIWQKINTELGAIGTFSTIPFDKAVLAIGKKGVHACNGANVERIDNIIPDEIFKFLIADNATNKIWGARVYQPELAVWTYMREGIPSTSNFPNTVMVLNYDNETWSFNNDCITCFGDFYQQAALTWQAATDQWQVTDYAWSSNAMPAQTKQTIFGNQQGFVSVIRPDTPRNAKNMTITDVEDLGGNTWRFTVINHNIQNGDFILIEQETAANLAFTNDGIFQVYGAISSNEILVITDAISFIVPAVPPDSGYAGGATIARVSRFDVVSKQWNPYIKDGLGLYLHKIVFAVSTTIAGSIQVDYNSDASEEDFVGDSGPSGTGARLGTSVLDTYPYTGFDTEGAERLWHPVYFQGQGNSVQIRMYLSDEQMLDYNKSIEDIEIQGLVLFTSKSSIEFM